MGFPKKDGEPLYASEVNYLYTEVKDAKSRSINNAVNIQYLFDLQSATALENDYVDADYYYTYPDFFGTTDISNTTTTHSSSFIQPINDKGYFCNCTLNTNYDNVVFFTEQYDTSQTYIIDLTVNEDIILYSYKITIEYSSSYFARSGHICIYNTDENIKIYDGYYYININNTETFYPKLYLPPGHYQIRDENSSGASKAMYRGKPTSAYINISDDYSFLHDITFIKESYDLSTGILSTKTFNYDSYIDVLYFKLKGDLISDSVIKISIPEAGINDFVIDAADYWYEFDVSSLNINSYHIEFTIEKPVNYNTVYVSDIPNVCSLLQGFICAVKLREY